MDGSLERSPGPRRRSALITLGAVSVAVGLIAVAITGPATPVAPERTPAGSQAAPLPTAGAPDRSTTPGEAPADSWSAVDLAPFAPAAQLSATAGDAAGVALDTAFILTSLGDRPVLELARAITVSPPLDLAIEPGADSRTATLRPRDALAAGALYRFTIPAPDGSAGGSWAFQARAPLRVASSIPGDETVDVPLTTGIEVTFDQDGVAGAEAHFSIQPPVRGTFEQHGRTLVFVPERLEPRTLYSVTISSGVRVGGSDEASLERDVRFRFETGGPGAPPAVRHAIARTVLEAPTSERAVLAVWTDAPSEAGRLATFPVRVFALPSLAAATRATQELMAAPAWASWSRSGLIETDGLERVAAFTAHPQPVGTWGDTWFRLPERLPAGWYVVVIPSAARDTQAILQVTDVATYAAVTATQLLAWVNDTASGRALPDAVVELIGAGRLGRTGADGLLVVDTPASLASVDRDGASGDPEDHTGLLVVRAADGRAALVPIGLRSDDSNSYIPELSWASQDAVAESYWKLLYSDRSIYRSSDTINVWGYLRDRDGGQVPDDVSLWLVPANSFAGDGTTLPLARLALSPDPSGVFSGSLAIVDAPLGEYHLELCVGEDVVATQWLSVDIIRKPAYRIDVEADRHILVEGDRVRATARATFFDGTAVPGVQLATDAFGSGRVTTDAGGTAAFSGRATVGRYREGSGWESLTAAPSRPEEGEISGMTSLRVFPSRVWLAGEGAVIDGRVVVDGSLHEVDVARLERDWDPVESEMDPKGAAVGGARVRATITEMVPVRVRTLRRYDFIAKRVIDVYEYRLDERARGTRSLTTGPDGSFHLDIPANADHDYQVQLSARDADGREIRLGVYASTPYPRDAAMARPFLGQLLACDRPHGEYGLDDALSLTMRTGAGPLPAGGSNRYLFLTTRRGLRDATVQSTPTFVARFAADWAPNTFVEGVRFTGSTYTPTDLFDARFAAGERALTVELRADRAHYAPGDDVTLDVSTTDRDGRPIPATMVLRAVDEKLYATGGAYDPDPLEDLYQRVGPGILHTYASHPVPLSPWGDGCGDTGGGGGGGRGDFRDFILFRQVTTDAAGRASVSFHLSDDITSWHVSAGALTASLEAGHGSLLVPVGLPFFVEATIAPEYLAVDRPTLRLRAFGSALEAGDRVTFAVSSATLPLARTEVAGAAFQTVDVPLPPAGAGAHTITVSASSGTGADRLSDTITRRFDVIETRLARTVTSYSTLETGSGPAGGPGLTTFVVSDAGRGRFLPALQDLAGASGPRVDQALAAAIARDLLMERFSVPAETLPPGEFDPSAYQRRGVALLPYASEDLALSARIALLAPGRFSRDRLAELFHSELDIASVPREQRILALTGLAAVGEPVLAELHRLVAEPELTVREQLYLALGLAASGDDTAALAIERDLLARYGERRGPAVRLRTGGNLDDTLEASALLAFLAAGLGDPLAAPAEAYLEANAGTDELFSLERAAVIRRLLERAVGAAGRFAYVVDGERRVVELAPGEAIAITVSESQRGSMSFERLGGELGIAASWRGPLDPDGIAADPSLSLTRTSTPSGALPEDALVEIRLVATFGAQAVDGCYRVTDLLPSGLAPVTRLAAWPDEQPASASGYVSPYEILGQRASFCAWPTAVKRTVTMRYFARVVTPGTYAWEPAVIQSATAAQSVALTAPARIVIR